jgi:hypothetical protein
LLLERDGETIACEISVTTTIDHEVGNVSKCAKAGFREIAVIAISEERLRKIEAAVTNSLGPDISSCVGYFLPDPYIERLQSRVPSQLARPSSPRIEERRGYKIKRNLVQMSAEEQKAREAEAIRLIAESMRPSQA